MFISDALGSKDYYVERNLLYMWDFEDNKHYEIDKKINAEADNKICLNNGFLFKKEKNEAWFLSVLYTIDILQQTEYKYKNYASINVWYTIKIVVSLFY